MKLKPVFICLAFGLCLPFFSQNACLREPPDDNYVIGNGINGLQPFTMTYADLNNDGQKDFIVTNISGDLSIRLCAGPNAYPTLSFFQLPLASPFESKTADFNNDNNLDLVTRYLNNSVVTIHFGNGAGTFTAMTSYTVPNFYNAAALRTGDFNNDSNQDIYLPTSGNPGDGVYLQGNGNGTFTQQNYYPNYSGLLIDLDNDGDVDEMHLSGATQNTLTIVPGQGSMSFGTPSTQVIVSQTNPSFLGGSFVPGDLNGDGNRDLVMMDQGPSNNNQGMDHLVALFGNSAGTYTTTVDLFYPGFPVAGASPRIEDVTNDGLPDIIVAGSTGYAVLTNQGGGNFSYGVRSLLDGAGSMEIVDVDGDQVKDMVVLDNSNISVKVRHLLPYTFIGAIGNCAIIDDADNDGVSEVFTTNSYSITMIRNLANSGHYGAATSYSLGDTPRSAIAVDLNNDGNKDLVTSSFSSSFISVLLGAGSGSFSPSYTVATGNIPWSVTSADFNNNGQQDLVLTLANSNQMKVLLGNGSGGFNITTFSTPNGLPNDAHVGDFNNDSNQDILVSYLSQSNLALYLGNGSGGFTSQTISQQALAVDVGYVNNDNNLDIVTARGSTISILAGNGLGGFSVLATYTLSNSGSDIKLVDLDGNAAPDLLVGSNWGFFKLMNTGSGTFLPPVSYAPGIDFTTIYTGLLNGDNLPDMVSPVGVAYLNTSSGISTLSGFSLCLGSSLVLNGPSAASGYTWMPGNSNGTSYTVTAGGTYSLVSSSGICTSNTSTVAVIALPSPVMNALSSTVCAGSSAVLSASGAVSYTWSTGATTSSISVLPLASTAYTVSGTGANNCSTSQTLAVTVNTACADVWPGDANSDGTASNLDVLELGLHIGQTGPARALPGNAWLAAYANAWNGTITNGKNLAHADCDGSGTVNLNDTLAIFNNYGQSHAFREQQTASNPDLSIVADQPNVSAGQWGSASVFLGSSGSPVTAIHGVAFTAAFDPTMLEADSIYLEYPVSFLNANGSNLNFRKRIFVSGLIHTATTHTNLLNVSGYGKIATLKFKLKQTISAGQIVISLGQANTSNAAGAIAPLTSGACTVQALSNAVGFNSQHPASPVSVFPNPVSQTLLISGARTLQRIELVTVLGQVVHSDQVSEVAAVNGYRLDMQVFKEGIYFIRIYDGESMSACIKVARN